MVCWDSGMPDDIARAYAIWSTVAVRNVSETARLLDMRRSTVQDWSKRYRCRERLKRADGETSNRGSPTEGRDTRGAPSSAWNRPMPRGLAHRTALPDRRPRRGESSRPRTSTGNQGFTLPDTSEYLQISVQDTGDVGGPVDHDRYVPVPDPLLDRWGRTGREEEFQLDNRFDGWTKQLGTETPRRKVVLGLGGLTLGAVSYLAARDGTAAAKNCHHACRRRCENRDQKCQDRCERRLCG